MHTFLTKTTLIYFILYYSRDYIQGKEESERPIDINSLRKYITYAKFYVHPILSSEAKEVIKRYYLQIRADRQMHSSIPVTARALESLVRLAEVSHN